MQRANRLAGMALAQDIQVCPPFLFQDVYLHLSLYVYMLYGMVVSPLMERIAV
jgi:hypothetical protein